MEHTFTVKYRFTMEWYDPRLVYHNLKTRDSANSLDVEEIGRIWFPFIVFENTEDNEATEVRVNTKSIVLYCIVLQVSVNTEVFVSREGDFSRSSDDVVEEINIFLGGENSLTFQQVYTKTFKCEYQLHMYPFDTQVGN